MREQPHRSRESATGSNTSVFRTHGSACKEHIFLADCTSFSTFSGCVCTPSESTHRSICGKRRTYTICEYRRDTGTALNLLQLCDQRYEDLGCNETDGTTRNLRDSHLLLSPAERR